MFRIAVEIPEQPVAVYAYPVIPPPGSHITLGGQSYRVRECVFTQPLDQPGEINLHKVIARLLVVAYPCLWPSGRDATAADGCGPLVERDEPEARGIRATQVTP